MSEFSSPTGIDWGNSEKTYGMVKYGDDSGLVVMFYTKSVFNAAKSRETGARQYDNQPYIRIHPPGERLNIIDRPVKEEDKHRFRNQWSNYLHNKTQVPEGTPIDLLFPNNPALADNLKAYGIFTVQQCSKLSAHALDTIGMGSTEWKNLAIKYLESAVDGAAFTQMQEEMKKKDQEIKLLKRQFEQLKGSYDDIVHQFKNPNSSGLQPGWQPNFDAQIERLEANHPSQEIRPSRKIRKNTKTVQEEIIPVITEENIPIVNVTEDQEEFKL